MDTQILSTDYAGRRGALFWLALKTSILTVLTIGIYRFWMKTRLRRYYWSAIRPGGVPLEYTGTGTEKLMGFLIAVVFLAFYIGVFNLILMFLSFSLLNGNSAAYLTSFIGIIPIYFFARYRARHYVLARTRWRGLRFGIDAGAWGYSWRAMLHWLATLLTLGFLLPRQIFWLEKYRTDRTWFGDEKFTQDGNWRLLLKPAGHYYFGIILSLATIAGGYFNPVVFSLFALSIPWLLIGLINLQIHSFRILAKHKRLGTSISFRAKPSTWRIIQIYLLGGLLVYVLLIAFIVLLAIIGIGTLAVLLPSLFSEGGLGTVFSANAGSGQPVVIVGSILVYFAVFIFGGVLIQVFITLPKARHYAETLTVRNRHYLGHVSQRARDAFTEAEGFADALDIGAAI